MTLDAAIIERLEDLIARVGAVQRAVHRVEQSQQLICQQMRTLSQRVGVLEDDKLTPIPIDHGDRNCYGGHDG